MRLSPSIRVRLMAATVVVLVVFLGFAGLGLDHAFKEASRRAQQDKMEGLIYGLLGAAEPRKGGLALAEAELPDRALARPESGRAAFISDDDGVIWSSESWVGPPPELPEPETGAWRFVHRPSQDRFVLAFGVRWLDQGQQGTPYTFAVVEDTSAYTAQLAAFRRSLGGWLIAAALTLLAMQLAVLWWGSRPIRRLGSEIRAIEAGHRDELKAKYPSELQPLTQALNGMIAAERERLQRQREALTDLAHSLKTPLAVLRGIAESPSGQWPQGLADQVATMEGIVYRQLNRASTAGRRALVSPIAIAAVTERTAGALRKVYAEQDAVIEIDIPDDLRVRMDEGDYYELAGNLIDNALKHGARQVRVSARHEADELHLVIEDDGPGFDAPPGALTARGARGNPAVPGQGIGLGSCRDIVASLDGELVLANQSALGGARVTVVLPGVVTGSANVAQTRSSG